MVFLNVKKNQESLFLSEKRVTDLVKDVCKNLVQIHNQRIKILQICYEIENLIAHGVSMNPEMQGLLENQIVELKLEDEEGDEICLPSGGFDSNPDPTLKRNGKAPKKDMKEVLERTLHEVRMKLSPDNIKANVCLTLDTLKECREILKGAITIVYPMGLPKHDFIWVQLESGEDLNGIREVVEEDQATIWFANKELAKDKPLSAYVGKNEKTKVVVKLSTVKAGQPTTERQFSPETHKKLLLANHKRMKELEDLDKDEDNSYLNSDWADSNALKRQFQGLDNFSWK